MASDFEHLLGSFVKSRGLVRFQIDSFNVFVKSRFQRIVDEIGEITPESERLANFRVKLGEVRFGKPSVKEADGSMREILPMEARLRDLTYSAPVFLEMTPIVGGVEQTTSEVKIGEIPIMLKSVLCPLAGMKEEDLVKAGEDPDDPGGYFIVNGTEKALVLIEEVAPNKPILEMKEDVATMRINSESRGWAQRHMLMRKADGLIVVSSVANIKDLPIVVLMRALGLESDKEIIEAITSEEKYIEEIYSNLYEADVTTSEDALEYISKKMKLSQKEQKHEKSEQVLDRYLLPHIGQDRSLRKKKALYLGRMSLKLMQLARGEIEEDDIDHYGNKRLKTSGDLLEMLVRGILLGKWGLIARINYNYQKIAKRGKVPSVSTVVESTVMTNQIRSSMATGVWIGGRSGVAQRLERANFTRSVAHLRNVISPLSTTQEHFAARELHATHWGRLDPSETPEGPTIGLRKYLSLMAEISTGAKDEEVKKLVDAIQSKLK